MKLFVKRAHGIPLSVFRVRNENGWICYRHWFNIPGATWLARSLFHRGSV